MISFYVIAALEYCASISNTCRKQEHVKSKNCFYRHWPLRIPC